MPVKTQGADRKNRKKRLTYPIATAQRHCFPVVLKVLMVQLSTIATKAKPLIWCLNSQPSIRYTKQKSMVSTHHKYYHQPACLVNCNADTAVLSSKGRGDYQSTEVKDQHAKMPISVLILPPETSAM